MRKLVITVALLVAVFTMLRAFTTEDPQASHPEESIRIG